MSPDFSTQGPEAIATPLDFANRMKHLQLLFQSFSRGPSLSGGTRKRKRPSNLHGPMRGAGTHDRSAGGVESRRGPLISANTGVVGSTMGENARARRSAFENAKAQRPPKPTPDQLRAEYGRKRGFVYTRTIAEEAAHRKAKNQRKPMTDAELGYSGPNSEVARQKGRKRMTREDMLNSLRGTPLGLLMGRKMGLGPGPIDY